MFSTKPFGQLAGDGRSDHAQQNVNVTCTLERVSQTDRLSGVILPYSSDSKDVR
jgi:hypothetical protein